MPHLLPTPATATQQLVVVLRAKRILWEAAEVAAGRLVAVSFQTATGQHYSLYPTRVVAHARQLFGAPTTCPSGLPVTFAAQGQRETLRFEIAAAIPAVRALLAHSLAAYHHTRRRIARNDARLARLRAQEVKEVQS